MKLGERNQIMKKKLYSLYCTFMPCKSFVSDFFIVEKTFPFYEKFLFSQEKTFAVFCFTMEIQYKKKCQLRLFYCNYAVEFQLYFMNWEL